VADLLIQYQAGDGSITERRISEVVLQDEKAFEALCHLRNERRTFLFRRIVRAVDADSGEVIKDIPAFFGVPRPSQPVSSPPRSRKPTSKWLDDALRHMPHTPEDDVSKALIRQRTNEKRELFKRFRFDVISAHYREKLLELFDRRCFKCGAEERLDIDHHIPIILGGHLVPGNLVVLCKRCNNAKGERRPSDTFTSRKEISSP